MSKTALTRFREGSYTGVARYFGAHRTGAGVRFRVWAPGAGAVSLVGDFNGWDPARGPMAERSPGVWERTDPAAREGDLYQYAIDGVNGERLYKADPVAFQAERSPGAASRVAFLSGYRWRDRAWMAARRETPAPMSIYEVHAASWRAEEGADYPSWAALEQTLIPYVRDMGYTHIELLPLTEHPYDGSWGYQTTGYFAPTSRYGGPKALMAFVDACHRAGLGVILDWVPGHFCRDGFGLGRFNGAPLYEGADHQQWGTYKFDFRRGQVRSFLLSSARYWLKTYHIDGLRVDGVTSMLYLNFGVFTPDQRREGEVDGDAVRFLRDLNAMVRREAPGAFTVAEESSDWPHVTGPAGLGFTYKWDMGWMNDTLRYVSLPFDRRGEHHQLLNFSMLYAFSERFLLPLSHDEVVHGKRSLIGRMPGDYSQQFRGLRLTLLYQLCHPGSKLLFMGGELGQFAEWDEHKGVEWDLLDYESHRAMQAYVRALNWFYRRESCLWADDGSWDGFQWLAADDGDHAVLAFLRRSGDDAALVLLNFSDHGWQYTVTPPKPGLWRVVFATEPEEGAYQTDGQGRLTLPLSPLSGLILKPEREELTHEA